MFFAYVSEQYRYRVRDEVVNEQYLIEEIYEREFQVAAEIEDEESDDEEEMLLSTSVSVQQYN